MFESTERDIMFAVMHGDWEREYSFNEMLRLMSNWAWDGILLLIFKFFVKSFKSLIYISLAFDNEMRFVGCGLAFLDFFSQTALWLG